MKILYINTFNPYVEAHGGATVTRKELELLKEMFDVTTLFSEPLKKRIYSINFPKLLVDVLKGKSLKQSSYNVLHQSQNFYKNFDLIFCNHDFSAYDFEIFNKIKKPFIVRKHNAEHLFFSNDQLFKAIERTRIKNFEEQLGRFSFCIIHLSSSEFLSDKYSHRKKLLLPPLISENFLNKSLGLDSYKQVSRPIDILCVTNYEWKPNREGFDWFFKEVAPRLSSHINIHLVGKGSERYASYQSVTSHGFVENVERLYASSKLFVSPVLSGTGIKVKNLEAMIYGVPVISTSLGVDGLSSLSEAGGVTIADTAESFADQLHLMLIDEVRCAKQRKAAELWVQSNIHGPKEWKLHVRKLIQQAVSPNNSFIEHS